MIRFSRRLLVSLFFLLLLLLSAGIWWWRSRAWEARQKGFQLPALLSSVSRIELSRGGESLSFTQRNGVWYTSHEERVHERPLQTLWDYFKRIDVRFPVAGTLSAEALGLLRDSGLHVVLESADGRLAFSLGRQPDGELLLGYAGDYYLVRTAGFARATIQDLSLDWRQWVTATSALGIQRPSELAFVQLEWCENPQESFRIEMLDSSRVLLFPSDAREPVPYDTVRMSAFLYALTQITLERRDSLSCTQRASFETQMPLLRLQFCLRHTSDTLYYALYPETSTIGYLRNSKGDFFATPLVGWNAVMMGLPQLASALSH